MKFEMYDTSMINHGKSDICILIVFIYLLQQA